MMNEVVDEADYKHQTHTSPIKRAEATLSSISQLDRHGEEVLWLDELAKFSPNWSYHFLFIQILIIKLDSF